MRAEAAEALWLDARQSVSFAQLVELSGLSDAELHELVEYGAFVPVDPQAPDWTFSAECVSAARTACRLRDDLDLDAHGLALVLTLLTRIRALETELQAVRAQLPGY